MKSLNIYMQENQDEIRGGALAFDYVIKKVVQLEKENEALVEVMEYLNSLLKSHHDIAQMGDSQDERTLTQAKKVLTQAMKFTTNN